MKLNQWLCPCNYALSQRVLIGINTTHCRNNIKQHGMDDKAIVVIDVNICTIPIETLSAH